VFAAIGLGRTALPLARQARTLAPLIAIALGGAGSAPAALAQPAATVIESASPAASSAAPTVQSLRLRAQADVERLARLPDAAPLIEQRRDAADRLLSLLSASEAGHHATPAGPAASSALAAGRLADPAPFSVLAVDRLHDERDALIVQRTAVQLALKSLDERVESVVTARRKAQEAVRLFRESIEGTAADGTQDPARAKLDLAELEARTAEQELAANDTRRAATRERLAELDRAIGSFDTELARAADGLSLSDADMTAIDKRLRDALTAVARERRVVLDRMAVATRTAAPDGADLAGTLATLSELESVYREQSAMWQLRRSVIAAQGRADELRALGARVAALIERLQGQLSVTEQQLDATRAARQIERIDAMPAGAGSVATAGASPTRDATERLVRAQRELRDALRSSLALLRRTQQEASTAGRPTTVGGRLDVAWALVKNAARNVWEFELFAASDTVQVDGRSVTLSRGVTVGKSVGLLLIIGIGYWLARALTRGATNVLVRQGLVTPQVGRAASRWTMWLLMAGVVMAALRMAHIPVAAFAFLGGALALGFGFGAQNVLKNFISGVIILFERKIRLGDILTVGGVSGTVSSIDLRATTLRGFDGIDTVVPNSVLLEGQVNNWSLGSPMVRRAISLGVAHGSDVRRAMQVVAECAAAQEGSLSEPAPNVLLEEFSGAALVLRVQYWLQLGGPLSGPEVDSQLRLKISDRLAEAGIAMAAT